MVVATIVIFLGLHLIADSDRDAVPWRCSSNGTINLYLWQLLTLHARDSIDLTLELAKGAVVDTLSDLAEQVGGESGGDGGGD